MTNQRVRFVRRVRICAAIAFSAMCGVRCAAAETALDRYVAKSDAVFAWKLAARIPGDGYTTFVLDLASQTWRSGDEVDRPVWKHWLSIVRPDKPRGDT